MESITLPSVAETADELYKLASKCGIIGALAVGFGSNVSVSIKVPKKLMDVPVEEYDFDTRVNNILNQWCKRNATKPKTVARIVELVTMGDRAREYVRGYGATTQTKLKNFLLNECYELLSEAERREFCVNVIIQNCRFEELL